LKVEELEKQQTKTLADERDRVAFAIESSPKDAVPSKFGRNSVSTNAISKTISDF